MLGTNGSAVRIWQQEQMAPYAYNSATKLWVGYDDVDSVAEKVSNNFIDNHHF